MGANTKNTNPNPQPKPIKHHIMYLTMQVKSIEKQSEAENLVLKTKTKI